MRLALQEAGPRADVLSRALRPLQAIRQAARYAVVRLVSSWPRQDMSTCPDCLPRQLCPRHRAERPAHCCGAAGGTETTSPAAGAEPVSAVALVCVGRRAVGRHARDIIGESSEITLWSDISEAVEVVKLLAAPFCGPRCLGFHFLAYHDEDGYHVVEAGSPPPHLNPLNQRTRRRRSRDPSYPPIDDLPEAACGKLLGTASKLAELRQPGLARWAEALSDALLARSVSLTTGLPVDVVDTEPVALAVLDAAELQGLHWIISASAEQSYDIEVIGWCTRMGRLIMAEFDRRGLEQAIIDARADMIAAEEIRRERESQPPPDLRGILPWSERSKPPSDGVKWRQATPRERFWIARSCRLSPLSYTLDVAGCRGRFVTVFLQPGFRSPGSLHAVPGQTSAAEFLGGSGGSRRFIQRLWDLARVVRSAIRARSVARSGVLFAVRS